MGVKEPSEPSEGPTSARTEPTTDGNWSDDEPLFRVWDRERKCWAGNESGPNVRDLEDYALDEFKDAHLVYCDMQGWALGDDGSLNIEDECGNGLTVDSERFEVRWNPRFLTKIGHAAAERWRERAEAAERSRDALQQDIQLFKAKYPDLPETAQAELDYMIRRAALGASPVTPLGTKGGLCADGTP